MNAAIDTSGMTSTIQPQRARPMATMMTPQITERQDAITGPGISGFVSFALDTIFPTRTDITATGWLHVRSVLATKTGLAYPNRDIFRRSKEPVDHHTHKRSVEAVFHRKLSKDRIGHSLGDNHGANGDTWEGGQYISEQLFHSSNAPATRSPISHCTL